MTTQAGPLVTWYPLTWRDSRGILRMFDFEDATARLDAATRLALAHDAYDVAFCAAIEIVPDPERLAQLKKRIFAAAGIAHVEAVLREAMG